jgi:agmatine/peptidylarginine deiminase
VVRNYTNSLIVNDVVILPVFGIPYDAAAISIYEGLFPWNTIWSVNAEAIIETGRA